MIDLTIIMPSFNKEDYIGKALDSIFMQKTNYSYHIIVADDCSVDNTINIVHEYQKKYPNKITLLTSEINQKLFKNVLRAYRQTKTDYFCVLDPDDYWINDRHIQNSLDFLNKHKDYTIYSTNVVMLKKDGTKENICFSKKERSSTYKDYKRQKAVIAFTQSVVYRNVIFKDGLPTKILNIEAPSQERSFRGDSFSNAIHIHEGKAYFSPDYDGVYRITDVGIWQSMSQIEQYITNCNIFKDLWLYYDKQDDELLLNAYKLYRKINKIFIDSLAEIKNRGKLDFVVSSLIDLNNIFIENKKTINTLQCKNSKFKKFIQLKFLNQK